MRLISHICTFIVVCVDVNSCTYSDSMFTVSVASHEKHDHCARMYSEALLAREKELVSHRKTFMPWKIACDRLS